MKAGTEDKKKLITACVLGVLALFAGYYLYSSFFGGPSTPPPAPAPVVTTRPTPGVRPGVAGAAGNAAVKVATVNGQLDPTLHMGPMIAAESLVYSGIGRNIFGIGPAPTTAPALVKTKFPARPSGASQPIPTGYQGPPAPPPINLKFFGVATRFGVKRALLLSGDDVFLASPGDIVQRRYRIVSIAANSIMVEDLPNSNQQSLPLVAN